MPCLGALEMSFIIIIIIIIIIIEVLVAGSSFPL